MNLKKSSFFKSALLENQQPNKVINHQKIGVAKKYAIHKQDKLDIQIRMEISGYQLAKDHVPMEDHTGMLYPPKKMDQEAMYIQEEKQDNYDHNTTMQTCRVFSPFR